jgi:hypothetical protein
MSREIQTTLAAFRTSEFDDLWAGKPNAWVRDLSAIRSSELGERLVLKVLGGSRPQGSENGYKVVQGDKYIEVRLATAGEMNGLPAIAWRNIRPAASFTHIAFIAVFPEDARMFLVPKSELPVDSLGVVKGSPGTYQLITRRVKELYPWMVRHEMGVAL